MKKLLVIGSLALGVTAFTTLSHPNDPEKIEKAIAKSLPLLQSSSYTFLVNAGGCHSCHGQSLGVLCFSMAKEKGYPVADSIIMQAIDTMKENWTLELKTLVQNGDRPAMVIKGGLDLWAFKSANLPSNRTFEMLARNILYRQRNDGGWMNRNDRPPLEYYNFTATALAIKTLQTWLPPVFKKEAETAIINGKDWLLRNNPVANEEKAFQLLGLTWANADRVFIEKMGKQLIADQRSNGGWSQLYSLEPDAYATGQSLYALYSSGQLKLTDPTFQKGIAFLLDTQKEDGSWNVVTRSFPTVPYVDSGFPHGANQFIAAAGSNWATIALLLADN